MPATAKATAKPAVAAPSTTRTRLLTIGDVLRIEDMQDGEQAMPERDTIYHVRNIETHTKLPSRVAFVVRNGEQLFAVLTSGERKCVAGCTEETGTWVLCPSVNG